jgi:hypothetical protein
MLSEKNATRYTLLVIGLTFIGRVLIGAFTGLGTGESYYFRGVLEPALSYFDQPPLFFWLSTLSVKILGLSALALRLPAILMFAGTSWILFLIARKLFNAAAGFYAVLLLNLCAVFTISVGNWFQPDAPLIFFWILTAYCLLQLFFPSRENMYTNGQNSSQAYMWWILTGVSMGLTTLSKYHIVFLLAGALLFAITTPQHRHWLKHPGPYLALLINLLFAFPILLWNYENHWASFVFQGSRVATEQAFQLRFDWFFRSIGGQALWLLPWIWVPLVFQLVRSYQWRAQQAYWFCFCTAVLPIVFFTVITLWSDLQFHFHWQAPGYLMLFIPLGEAVRKSLQQGHKLRKLTQRWLVASGVLTIVSITALAIHMETGFWTWYGPKWLANSFGEATDPTIDGNDYVSIQERFEKEGWLSDTTLFVGTPRWWLNGKVDWALKGQKEVLCFHRDARNYAFFTDPRMLKGKDAILIGRGHHDNILHDAIPFFESYKQLEDIQIMRGGVPELSLEVYYCQNFQLPDAPKNELPVYRTLSGLPPIGDPRPELTIEGFKIKVHHSFSNLFGKNPAPAE